MVDTFKIGEQLPGLVDRIVASYKADERTHYLNRTYLPSRQETIEIVQLLLELAYPGYHGRQRLNDHNVSFHVGELLPKLGDKLFGQIDQCLCYEEEQAGRLASGGERCVKKARRMTLAFLEKITDVREMLAGDVQAAYDGDPAAVNTDEVILAYPGVLAVSVYRFAHELHLMEIPLMPRIMTEWAHSQTGIDIHPGAAIGRNFFIDHGTGVVIGETAEIGNNVKLYQGVTLGAMSFPKDERGRIIRGYKRHPSVEDDVTLYANAIVLGGETKIGSETVVGGSVFITNSIPPQSTVTLKGMELKVRKRKPRDRSKSKDTDAPIPDFQI